MIFIFKDASRPRNWLGFGSCPKFNGQEINHKLQQKNTTKKSQINRKLAMLATFQVTKLKSIIEQKW